MSVICLALLTACASGGADATAPTALVARYISAATGVEAYARAPGADPAKLRTVRLCDLAAWPMIKPISDAMLAKQQPSAAAVSAASGAVDRFQSCMASQGVPPA